MPHGFDNTWAYVKDSGESHLLLSIYLFRISNIVYFSCFIASVRPHITNEQKAFIHRITEIPLDKWKCWDLITLDTLYAYCGGPEPIPEARRINAYSRRREFICFNSSFFFFCWLV